MKAKLRLFARGFKHREGIDFGETFAPNDLSSCARLLGVNARELDLDVRHYDIDEDVVEFKLDEGIFRRLSKGCGNIFGKIV